MLDLRANMKCVCLSQRAAVRAASTVAVLVLVVLAAAPSASAFSGGGRKPSEAPLILAGQHYNGELSNHKDDANFAGSTQVAIWRLPPLSTRDVIYVDWHSVPIASESGYFPVCLTFAQGIDDFNWGTRFDEATGYECESGRGPVYRLSGSGTARTAITVPETNTNSSYLEFFTEADSSQPSQYESFPYDFTLESPLHYLGLGIRTAKRVAANGILEATATLANGLPAPDGLPFNLTVTWPRGGTASYTATSSGGVAAFQLALPETAYDQRGIFLVVHPADGVYAEARKKLGLNIKKPTAAPPSPCMLARHRVRAVGRQLHRLRRHANAAHGRTRRALRHRAGRVRRKLRAARASADKLCE